MIVVCWFAVQMVVIGGFIGWEAQRLGTFEAAIERVRVLEEGGAPWVIALIWRPSSASGRAFSLPAGCSICNVSRHSSPRGRAARSGSSSCGFGLAVVFAGASDLVGLTITQPVRTDLSIATWLIWLLPIGILVFLQAVGEELIFRGYLLQQLARLSRNPLVWAVLPSLTFGLAHLANAPVGRGRALLCRRHRDQRGRSGGAGLALGLHLARAGLHFGINITAITVIGSEGLLSGAQLFEVPKTDFLR